MAFFRVRKPSTHQLYCLMFGMIFFVTAREIGSLVNGNAEKVYFLLFKILMTLFSGGRNFWWNQGRNWRTPTAISSPWVGIKTETSSNRFSTRRKAKKNPRYWRCWFCRLTFGRSTHDSRPWGRHLFASKVNKFLRGDCGRQFLHWSEAKCRALDRSWKLWADPPGRYWTTVHWSRSNLPPSMSGFSSPLHV